MRRLLAARLYAWAQSLWPGPGPLCETCRELTVRIGTGATRAERRRAMRHGWTAGGKGK